MPHVKGSKEIKMVVVPHRPWRKAVLALSVLLALGLTGLGAHYFGYYRGTVESGEAQMDREQFQVENATYREQVTELRQQLVNTQQASEVDRQALEDVQETITDQREYITELEEELLFYKQVMAPEEGEQGLVIGQFELFPTEEPGHFRYRLALMQVGNNESEINGHVNVNILGHENGEQRSIPLQAVSDAEDEENIGLRFKYYQNVEGELALPESFSPEQVQVLAASQGDATPLEKTFDWVVQSN